MRAHNRRHMLAYGALMTGQREVAMKHVRAMVAELPADWVKENARWVTLALRAVPSRCCAALPMIEVLGRAGQYP